MKLSTRTRYGMRALMDLAIHGSEKPVQLKDIAKRQDISLSYLEHLVMPLISAGIVQSTRGAHGGMRLGRPAHQIRLVEIMEILEGPLAPVECLKDSKSCPRSGACATQDVWNEMKEAIGNVLRMQTLHDLAERQKTKYGQSVAMYHI
jgi:Rrf2 family cysteine metabolism transcriptional repressor